MARVTGKNGAVQFFTGINANFNTWRMDFSHPVDDDTSYDDVGTGSSHSGSGTVDYNLSASGFLKAHVTASDPGFSTAVASVTGGTVTCTADTSCTQSGVFILAGGGIDHAKRSGAIPVQYNGMNDGDLSSTWATT